MSIKLMSWAWETDFPQTEKMVLLCLADYANDNGACWPAIDSIARKCSVSDRTVQRAIKHLTEMGILTVDTATGKANQYHIHPRHSVTPVSVSPPTMTPKPPTQCHHTPDTVSPKPSKNHQEPPVSRPSDDAHELVEDWNSLADELSLPRVVKLDDGRRRKIRAALKRNTLDEWKEAFRAIRRSPFLRGEGRSGFRADFDFLLQPKSFNRMIEGFYDGKVQ